MESREEFLERVEKELELLTQDELYDLLVSLGLKGLKKLENGKGQVIIIEEVGNGQCNFNRQTQNNRGI